MTRFLLTLTMLVALAGAACGPAPGSTTDVCKDRKVGDLVITELMIDPDGTDTGGEWIEVFNPSGTPLELKGLTVYTKSASGSGLKTHVIRAGTVPAGGYLAMGDVRSGPNPSWIGYSYADGLGSMSQSSGTVGVRCGTVVLDEFTYTLSVKSGRSRMLGNTGLPSSTFNDAESAWCDTPTGNVYVGANAGTPGAANPSCTPEAMVGTCVDGVNGIRPISPPGTGDLIVTEVMAYAGVATDSVGEWFEVLVQRDVDLNDLSINTSTGRDSITSGDCLRVRKGDYVLFARSTDTFINGALPTAQVTYGTGLSNNNERLDLHRGDAGIDQVAFFKSDRGVSWQLDSALLTAPGTIDPRINDDPASFCYGNAPWPDGGGDFGTPGAANTTCLRFADAGVDGGGPVDAGDPNSCVDAVSLTSRPIVEPAVGDLVITEWMPDPSSVTDTNGEWFEVRANRAVDLNGVTLGNEGTTTAKLVSTTCLSVAAGGYALFAKSSDSATNGGLPTPMGTFGFSLGNSSARAIRVLSRAGVELDRVAYSSAVAGASTQLDVSKTAPADNDDTANLCATDAAATYGAGDRGTPGAANLACQ